MRFLKGFAIRATVIVIVTTLLWLIPAGREAGGRHSTSWRSPSGSRPCSGFRGRGRPMPDQREPFFRSRSPATAA